MGDVIENSEKDDVKAFNDLFEILLNDLTTSGLTNEETKDAFNWFRRVNEYNVPYGKKNRGLTVVQSFRCLASSYQLTEDELTCAAVVGWCVEWLQAFFLVADDVMDSSLTRRGQPCWYKVDGVGLKAVNDSIYLENAIYVLLKKYLRNKPYYVDIVDLFHEMTMHTISGQTLDLITSPTDHVDFTSYTMNRYSAIVKYKTAFYSFYLPVACAMYMAGITDLKLLDEAKKILLKMGEFFQIQDDFIDCYGDPAITGKIGTDIEENKCSWLIVEALVRANEKQKSILQKNYGCHDANCVQKVKEVYSELKLKDVYAKYEESSFCLLMNLIDEMNVSLPKEMFKDFAKKIYKRQK